MFRMLGPLEIDLGNVCVRPGPTKSRLLLMALLLERNHVMPARRLIELMWDGSAPTSASANLRTYAAALRSALLDPDGSGSRLVARRPGYLLRVATDELDMAVFKREIVRARTMTATGDTRGAAAAYERALRLWRGPADDNLCPGTLLSSRLTSLDEQRLSAVEEHADLRLALGAHAGLVAQLRQLTAEHPLRERLWCQLMRALYAGGDSAGALRAFRSAKEALDVQLGLDPGTELCRIQRMVLSREDTGAGSAERTVIGAGTPDGNPAPVPVPREAPPPAALLVGRSALERRVVEVFNRSTGPLAVGLYGPAGAGASTLAIRIAHQMSDRFPDGQVYLDLGGNIGGRAPITPDAVLRRVLHSLGDDSGGSTAESAARYQRRLISRRLFVLVDNVATMRQVRALIPTTAGCAVLMTGRAVPAADAVLPIEVGPLDQQAAIEMLGRLCGTERLNAEPRAVARLVEFSDHLPYVLHLLGMQLVVHPRWSVQSLVDYLADERHRLAKLRVDGDTASDRLRVGYDLLAGGAPLDRLAARLFALLGRVRPGTVTVRSVCMLLDTAPEDAIVVLDRLVGQHLLVSDGPERYRLAGLMRLVAESLVPGETAAPEAMSEQLPSVTSALSAAPAR
jgi:DNA-binding SARP family transcriptional activator